MASSYRTEETVGYGRRLKSSLGGALFGLALFAAGFPLLFWNEGRAVAEHKALQEGAGAVADAPAAPVDPAREGRLVHVSAKATAAEPVADPDFGVTEQALALVRRVEMFVWLEHEKTRTEKQLGGSEKRITTYSYDTGWSDAPVDSDDFHHPDGHRNPDRFPFERQRFEAPVRFGDFALAPELTDEIGSREPVMPSLQTLPPNLAASFQLDDGMLVTSKNPAKPDIGDLRVRFERVPEQMLSVIGTQRGNTLMPYIASNGRAIALVERGDVSAAQMFAAAESRNGAVTWVVRGAGFGAMWIGLMFALGWIGRVFDVVPFLGTLIERGIGILAALVALAFAMLTVAVAWFFYRPMIADALVALAVATVLTLRARARTKNSSPPPAGPAMPPPPPT